MTSQDYIQFQISASEALRAGGYPGISKQERIEHFDEAEKWATKAFLAAKDNVYLRYLSICQATCATGLKILVEQDYNSVVVAANDPDSIQFDNEIEEAIFRPIVGSGKRYENNGGETT